MQLRLDYRMDDDYGVVEAKATFALKDGPSPDAAPSFAVHCA